MRSAAFQPWKPLVSGLSDPSCRAVVIIPARNEETTLNGALTALAMQVDLGGKQLARQYFEILLLLNNCTDRSADVAAAWSKNHSEVRLHVVKRNLPAAKAFVGTARRMLMDAAWHRLARHHGVCGILSTDSDTLVSGDWLARNMATLEAGADAVGGVIALKEGELQELPHGVRRAYLRDRKFQLLVAELEDRLDPQEGDRWPRHLEHFGASLGCTRSAYERAGGMPPVTPLEDVAFVAQLRRAGAVLRHDPAVRVYTSARMQGRVDVGLSGQLSRWQDMCERNEVHRVQSAAWLAHRFRTLKRLRLEASAKARPVADYLAEVDCDRVVLSTFRGKSDGAIIQVNRNLAAMLGHLNPSPDVTDHYIARGDPTGNPRGALDE